MTTAVLEPRTHPFDVEDIEYLRHGDKPLLARVFRPRGQGPFPALVECHGGAWCLSNRTAERLRHEAMAKNGIVSIALDFRSGNEDSYPSSVTAMLAQCPVCVKADMARRFMSTRPRRRRAC
jgi:acetyl esterase